MTLLVRPSSPQADGISERGPALLPLDAGEQYRFAFAMDACIGCHSCEVACAEQNGNPPGVNWRRVGELEGGVFPATRRFNLSMACNHCLEPACMQGCPTNAYVKLANGIVAHQANECIGCQYCVWNCPYEVPVFNPDRRIVTKCDLCRPRLDAGFLPACVDACPTRAITVETVNVAAWRADHGAADAPGLPPSSITLSTTRIEVPVGVPDLTSSPSDQRVVPEDAHWPLIALTLLTQLAFGAVSATVVTALAFCAHPSARPGIAGGALAAFAAGALALITSVAHLGRPAHAWKALRNIRRSWLSREVGLFGAFAALAMLYALTVHHPAVGVAAGISATIMGAAGVAASGMLYLVPARPVWNSPRTLIAFFATAAATGPLAALLAMDPRMTWPGGKWLLGVSAAGTAAHLLVYRQLMERVASRREREYRATANRLFGRFRRLFFARIALAAGGGMLIAVALVRPGHSPVTAACIAAALLTIGAGELIGRYLFYVTVTPMSTPGTLFRHRA